MNKRKTFFVLTLVGTLIFCTFCSVWAKADVNEQRKLFVYLEGDKENFQDKGWLSRIADVVSGAVFLYGDHTEISIEVYKVAQSWEVEQGKPIYIGTYASDDNGYSNLLSDLTGKTVADKSRNQRSNEKLFNGGITKMMDLALEAGYGTPLLVFSDSAYKAWYPNEEQSNLNLVVITKDTEGNGEEIISNALETSVIDLAVAVCQRWTDNVGIQYRSEDPISLIPSHFIYDQRILAEGVMQNDQGIELGRRVAGLSLYSPGQYGYNGVIDSDGMIAVFNRTVSCTLAIDVNQREYEKGKPIEFLAHILNDQDGNDLDTEEWTATAHLINEKGEEIDQFVGQGKNRIIRGAFTAQMGGQYYIRLDAQNPAWFGKKLSIESEIFTVLNKEPTTKTTSVIDVPIWIMDGETDDYMIELVPEDYWSDDNQLSELTFELVEKNLSVDLVGHTLYIHKAFLEKDIELAVQAVDAEKAAGGIINIVVRPFRVTDIFSIDCHFQSAAGEDGKYGKHELISIEGEIKTGIDSLPEYENEWSVEAIPLDGAGDAEQSIIAKMNGNHFNLSFELSKSGPHYIEVTAHNTKMEGWTISKKLLLDIRNNAPEFIGTSEDLTMDVWINPIVEKEYTYQINLADYFKDDGDINSNNRNSDLQYRLGVWESEGITLETNGLLRVDPEIIQRSWDIPIEIIDEEGEKASQQIHIHRWDIKSMLADPELWITEMNCVQLDQKEKIYKDTPIEIQARLRFNDESLLKYWQSVDDDKNKFLGFPITMDLQYENAENNTVLQNKEDKLIWNEEENCFKASIIFDQSRKAGNVFATMHLDDLLGNHEIVSESLKIIERSPVAVNTDIHSTIIIPGPWIINAELAVKPYEVDLGELVHTEVFDELVVRVSSSTDGCLYALSENRYLFTDNANFEGTKVSETIWSPAEHPSFVLELESTHWGEHQIAININDRGEEDGARILVKITAEYLHQKKLLIAGLSLAFLLVAGVLILIIRYATKPAFDQDDRICLEAQVGSGQRDMKVVWLCRWKKSKISLRTLIIYSGVGVIGNLQLDACDKVFLYPARRKGERAGFYLINSASRDELQIYIDSNLQPEKKIHPGENERIEIVFKDTDTKFILYMQ